MDYYLISWTLYLCVYLYSGRSASYLLFVTLPPTSCHLSVICHGLHWLQHTALLRITYHAVYSYSSSELWMGRYAIGY